ncbi:MAG TPA: patatin-like phospholipase family protein [Bauldia sp.]|nr:patatin-like phospholipase family protein [Bauldia sp.]
MQKKNHDHKPINLALQGGGAHGAFTWGVIDKLLEDGRLTFDAVSGTSAGAMNAVVMIDGFARGGPDGARERLQEFWLRVSRGGGKVEPGHEVLDEIIGFWRTSFQPFSYFPRLAAVASPYRFNPLNINPLRDLLESLVDFDRVQNCKAIRLFISATNVRTGKIKLFSGKEVTADAVMASACLPNLFHAVEIDGEAYWDGGYMGNPALFPFFEDKGSDDILLVQVNPIRRDEVPRTGSEIVERVSEITFNASLLRELRAIDFVNRLLAEHRLDTSKYRPNRLHRIEASKALRNHNAATKMDTSWSFFQELHHAGREAAAAFLHRHYANVGVRATLDLRAELL